MKPLLLLTFSFTIAVAQVARAEDSDDSKRARYRAAAAAAKGRTHSDAPRQRAVAPQNIGPAAVRPQAPQGSPRINRVPPGPRTYGGPGPGRVRVNPPVVTAQPPRSISPVQPSADVAVARYRPWRNRGDRNRDWRNRDGQNPDVTTVRPTDSTIGVQADTNRGRQDWRNRDRSGESANGRNRNWEGRNSGNWSYEDARRRHHRGHHHRNWWRSRYNRIVLFGGGYYFWDNNYWYPAYGYDPSYNTYAYDEPIYGYNGLPPGQVIANVQSALQEQGYYRDAVDGLIGPNTRLAIANYQRDRGLAITSAIDGPTLQSLGLY